MADTTDSARILAANIRRELAQRGMTQTQLATLMGVPHPRVAEILACRYNARLDTLDRVAAALGLSAVDLLTPSDAEKFSQAS